MVVEVDVGVVVVILYPFVCIVGLITDLHQFDYLKCWAVLSIRS